jgi:2-phospho-L-lactate guanylyltransferase
MTISDVQNGQSAVPPDSAEGFHMLVPVKTLADAKRRLEAALGALRADLTVAMLTDVLNAIRGSSRVSGTLVVTADARVSELAGERGARVLREASSEGLNRALASGFSALHQAGATRIAIVPADIPLLTGEDLDCVLDLMDAHRGAVRRGVIGLCASRDGRGTNLMCLDRVADCDFRYGRNSFHLHRKAALAAGYRPVTLTSQRISLDIDTRADIDHFLAICMSQPAYRRSHTWRFLQAHGFAAVDDRAG